MKKAQERNALDLFRRELPQMSAENERASLGARRAIRELDTHSIAVGVLGGIEAESSFRDAILQTLDYLRENPCLLEEGG
jgi:hypothetical protein